MAILEMKIKYICKIHNQYSIKHFKKQKASYDFSRHLSLVRRYTEKKFTTGSEGNIGLCGFFWGVG